MIEIAKAAAASETFRTVHAIVKTRLAEDAIAIPRTERIVGAKHVARHFETD